MGFRTLLSDNYCHYFLCRVLVVLMQVSITGCALVWCTVLCAWTEMAKVIRCLHINNPNG